MKIKLLYMVLIAVGAYFYAYPSEMPTWLKEIVTPIARPSVPTPPLRPMPPNPLLPNKPKRIGDTIAGPTYEGRALQCDLPGSQHLKNTGGSDGAGLCVFTSIDMASRWQNVLSTQGFRDYMTKFPGGGYPQKVDEYIKKICKEKNCDVPQYTQITDGNMDVLDLALRTNRIACVTYGYSPRYGQKINHMVCLVHLDEKYACILDNNFPGEDKYEWITRADFKERWLMQSGGWGFIFLDPPPPPIPVNQ